MTQGIPGCHHFLAPNTLQAKLYKTLMYVLKKQYEMKPLIIAKDTLSTSQTNARKKNFTKYVA